MRDLRSRLKLKDYSKPATHEPLLATMPDSYILRRKTASTKIELAGHYVPDTQAVGGPSWSSTAVTNKTQGQAVAAKEQRRAGWEVGDNGFRDNSEGCGDGMLAYNMNFFNNFASRSGCSSARL